MRLPSQSAIAYDIMEVLISEFSIDLIDSLESFTSRDIWLLSDARSNLGGLCYKGDAETIISVANRHVDLFRAVLRLSTIDPDTRTTIDYSADFSRR